MRRREFRVFALSGATVGVILLFGLSSEMACSGADASLDEEMANPPNTVVLMISDRSGDWNLFSLEAEGGEFR